MDSERAFLHDIASPLATATLLMEVFLEDATEAARPPEELASLKTALEMLEKMRAMIIERQVQVRLGSAS